MRDPGPTRALLLAVGELAIDWRGDRITGDRRGLESLAAVDAAARAAVLEALDADLLEALDAVRALELAGETPITRRDWCAALDVVRWWVAHADRWPGLRDRLEAHAVWPHVESAAWR